MAEPTSMILDLAVGEVGEVPLERYGTAGYAWEVLPPPPGLAPPEIVSRGGGAGGIGAANLETLRLRATAPGEHLVVLRLRRPWESTAVRELRITVRAR
ncbi:protease inhibitor I42 family protein [Dankookia sp. P2]|uniref:protease inhibitor I42 family protein n=1 Tax=Dankookia sp. P2 TaxID=3423955 RepID=UPI003D66EDBF